MELLNQVAKFDVSLPKFASSHSVDTKHREIRGIWPWTGSC